jgi:hypothetical protein
MYRQLPFSSVSMFICVVQKYAVYKYITTHKSFQLGVKITSTYTGRDSCFMDGVSNLLALLQTNYVLMSLKEIFFFIFRILIRLST